MESKLITHFKGWQMGRESFRDELRILVEALGTEAQSVHDGDPETWSNGFMDCHNKVLALLEERP